MWDCVTLVFAITLCLVEKRKKELATKKNTFQGLAPNDGKYSFVHVPSYFSEIMFTLLRCVLQLF